MINLERYNFGVFASQSIYRFAQEKFSRTQRVQRKFRVESIQSAAKLAQSDNVFLHKQCLALKQLRHFCDSRHSFAKIFIHYTIYCLLALFVRQTFVNLHLEKSRQNHNCDFA